MENKLCLKSTILLFLIIICLNVTKYCAFGQSATKYEPDWSSLDQRPLPKWYDEAKVGIFIHWGVYSVPSMGSEWFWTDWKSKYQLYDNKHFVYY